MKKLMIAAAAAALVGGAFAEETTAYTFTASVKTTVGKAGKTTTYYYLGVNDDGDKFWYQDDDIFGTEDGSYQDGQMYLMPRYFETKTINGRTIPCLSAEGKADIEWLKTYIIPLQATYGNKSAKKWCESGKFVEEGCYRVAGTKKFSTVVFGNFCCEALKDEDDAEVLSFTLTQRFGSLSYQTAKKVEIYGTAMDSAFTLAGQGSVGKVLTYDDAEGNLATEDLGITSVSGYLVGTLDAPDCVNCCSLPDAAVAFTCDDPTQNDTLDTAAFGTFSLKYNAKATKALAN